MNHYPEKVKEKLLSILKTMSESHWLFSKNPGHDFMRQDSGKLSFYDTMKLIISMGKGCTDEEIIQYFDMDFDKIPSQSAFNQRRSQISLDAFRTLFQEFSTSFPTTTHQFKGHCILAADGTHTVYSTNPQILEDYNKPYLEEHRGYNHMHLNAFVDVISKSFLDVTIQPGQCPNERAALHTMLDHFQPENPKSYILTADRGYESYDLLFHCELKKLKYVFRVKSPSSRGKGILVTYRNELPDESEEEFDIQVRRFFTTKLNGLIKNQPQIYYYMNPTKNTPHFFDYRKGKSACYVSFRILKIKTAPKTYEYLITNLPFSFTIEDIKECYHLRWGIETSFRYLKHAAGLLHFHSKKPEFLKQEIYATLICYNMGTFIAHEAVKENQKKKRRSTNKWKYEINFSLALKLVRAFLLRASTRPSIDLLQLIMKYVYPVKEKFRMFKRPLRGIGAIRFGYR